MRGMDPTTPLPSGRGYISPRVSGSLKEGHTAARLGPTAFRAGGLSGGHVGAPLGVSEPAGGAGGLSDSRTAGGEGGRCTRGEASGEEGRASRGAAWGRGDLWGKQSC